MPHGIARDSGPQASAALPQSAGEAGGANEEQSERAADGSGCAVQPAEGASKEVLCRVATNAEEGDAAIDAGVITTEPIDGGSSYGDATAADSGTGKGCPAGGACGAAGEHSRRRPRGRPDLGAGDGRHPPLRIREKSRELLRVVRSREEFGRQDRANADLKTEKQAFANHSCGSGETGAAMEHGTGAGLRARETERKSQPGHTGRGAQTGGLPDGRRPRTTAVRHTA